MHSISLVAGLLACVNIHGIEMYSVAFYLAKVLEIIFVAEVAAGTKVGIRRERYEE